MRSPNCVIWIGVLGTPYVNRGGLLIINYSRFDAKSKNAVFTPLVNRKHIPSNVGQCDDYSSLQPALYDCVQWSPICSVRHWMCLMRSSARKLQLPLTDCFAHFIPTNVKVLNPIVASPSDKSDHVFQVYIVATKNEMNVSTDWRQIRQNILLIRRPHS